MVTELGGKMFVKYICTVLSYCILFLLLGTNTIAAVGDEVCLGCHEEANSIMMESSIKKVSCEACHGEGDIHVDNPSQNNIITLLQPTALQVKQACMQCHIDKSSHSTSHLSSTVNCLTCHKIMVNKGDLYRKNLLKNDSSNLCLGCHSDKNSTLNLPYTHKGDRQENVCITCHSSHETKVELHTNAITNKCKSCHPEEGGPFMYVHLGTENNGCNECHNPHGSTNANMLNRQDVGFLCLSCHIDTPSFHDMSNLEFRKCTSCHSAVHGSNINKNLLE